MGVYIPAVKLPGRRYCMAVRATLFRFLPIIFFILVSFLGCIPGKDSESANEVVVYTSVDQVYSSKIFKMFEEKTGIRVKPLYDAEASKAVGLKKRLIAEMRHPRADLFWNSEPLQTLILAETGIFLPYKPPNIEKLYFSKDLYDAENYLWFGMGGRLRVIVVNPQIMQPSRYPKSLDELWSGDFSGKVVLSYPFAGTAVTHFSALYSRIGEKRFLQLAEKIKRDHTAFVAGNSVVMESVASGEYSAGVTDTDDVLSGIRQKKDVKALCYDQDDDGNYLFYGTVSMVKGGPNPKNAEKLIDFLLSPETEQALAEMGAIDTTLLSRYRRGACKYWTLPAKKLLEGYREGKAIFKEMIE